MTSSVAQGFSPVPAGNDLAPLGRMDVGQRLFTARQQRGLTLGDISRSTKIPVAVLAAIERNDAARLPHEFFARAFVRTYAHEVGVNPGDLLDDVRSGGVEEVAVNAVLANVAIPASSSSKSLVFLFGIALGAACAVLYSGFASPAPVLPPVVVASVPDPPEPASSAPPPCASEPADAPVQSVQRAASAVASVKRKIAPAAPGTQFETSGVDSSPAVSDAVLPNPDPAPSSSPAEQF